MKSFELPEYVEKIKIWTHWDVAEAKRNIRLLWEKAGEATIASGADHGIRYAFFLKGGKIMYKKFIPLENDNIASGEADDNLLQECAPGIALDVYCRLKIKAKMQWEKENA